MRLPPISRRWLIAGSIGLGLLLVVVIGLGIVYPRVGAHMIHARLGDKAYAQTGRKVTFGNIDVSLGNTVQRDVNSRGPRNGAMPLVHIVRIEVDFDATSSLIGTLKLGPATVDG